MQVEDVAQIGHLSMLVTQRNERPGALDTVYIEIGDIDPIGKQVALKEKPAVASAQLAKQGDLLVSTVRPGRGAVALAPCRAAVSLAMTVLYGTASADTRFAFHVACRPEFAAHLDRLATGSTYPTCSDRDVLSFPTAIPSGGQRKRITALLDDINTLIWKTEVVIAKLEQVRAGLLHDLLTRGLDERGHLRDPIGHPEQFQNSPLGRIPRAWRVVAARDLCSTITKGTTPPASAFASKERFVRYLRVDNLTFTGDLDLSPAPLFVDRSTHETVLSRSIVVEDDVLMNIVGPPLGKVSVVPKSEHEWNVNQAIAVFRVDCGVTPFYLSRWLLSSGAQSWFRREAKRTSGQVNLTLEMCGNLPVPVPADAEQDRIVDLLRRMETEHSAQDAVLRKVQDLKSGLMTDLLTGRVRVPGSLFPLEDR